MQTILPPSGNTIKILGKARSAEHGLRWMHYVLAQPVEGGVLVFHTLTRALLLLTPEEYAAPDNLPELRDGWFRVPQEIQSFREYWEPIEACKTCFYYPECIRLKKCVEQKECFEEMRAEYKEHLLKSILTIQFFCWTRRPAHWTKQQPFDC